VVHFAKVTAIVPRPLKSCFWSMSAKIASQSTIVSWVADALTDARISYGVVAPNPVVPPWRAAAVAKVGTRLTVSLTMASAKPASMARLLFSALTRSFLASYESIAS